MGKRGFGGRRRASKSNCCLFRLAVSTARGARSNVAAPSWRQVHALATQQKPKSEEGKKNLGKLNRFWLAGPEQSNLQVGLVCVCLLAGCNKQPILCETLQTRRRSHSNNSRPYMAGIRTHKDAAS